MSKILNLNKNVIFHLMGNPAENKALYTAGSSGSADAAPRMTESGRSMVEMLGVLAVIGVLSVAGIAGYTTAMRSYRTNEIVNAASMFYVLAKSQNQGNGPSGDIDYATVGGTNPSGATLTYTNNAFTITFTDTDDCTMAANKLGDKATADCDNKKITVNFGESTTSNSPEALGYNPNDPAKDCSDPTCCQENGGEWITAGRPGYGACVPEGWIGGCHSGEGICIACLPDETIANSVSDIVCVPKGYTYKCARACKICSPAEGTAWCADSGNCDCCLGEVICDGEDCSCQ